MSLQKKLNKKLNGQSKAFLAIVLYRGYVDGIYSGSIDLQVKYFICKDKDDVKSMIENEEQCKYIGGEGNEVAWILDEIVCIEQIDDMISGEELIGFIRNEKEFSK